ncbi:hypothetical protein TNCV_3435281 [Trichonephila clavipes]|nr:hypothetical protein TNCV_3435281 [Trichonephila clavipes]
MLRARILHLSLALALITMQLTVRFCSVHPILKENTLEREVGGTSLPLPPSSREELRLDGYLEYSHAEKALYIYKQPCLLRNLNPGPTAPHDEAHFWLNGYVNEQNCRIWSEANPQVYVETPLHPEKLTVWCALWAGGILLQKR